MRTTATALCLVIFLPVAMIAGAAVAGLAVCRVLLDVVAPASPRSRPPGG